MWSKRRPRVLAPTTSDAAYAPSRNAWLGLLATCVGLAGACTEDPYPTALTPPERKVSEEIFFIVCKRVARDFFTSDVTGLRFDDACDGRPDSSGLVATAPRLKALVERRARVISALDQSFGDLPVPDGAAFAPGELDQFLVSIVPYYDPPEVVLPTSTRAIGNMLNELIKPLDPVTAKPLAAGPDGVRSEKVLETLARVGARKGYRTSSRALGAIRPVLTYPGLDEVGQQLLGLVADGGSGRKAFMDTLKAAALELAEPREPDPNPDDTTLHLVLDQLLLAEDPKLAEPGQPELLVLKRDANGDALRAPNVPEGSPLPTPFPVVGRNDGAPRDANGAARDFYQFFDANKTALGAGMREAKRIVERPGPGQRSTLENVSRGLRPWLGPTAQRTYNFDNGRAYQFEGPDPAKGPIFDLIHAVGVIAGYEETLDAVKLLSKLIGDPDLQDTSASFDKMALDINETSKRPEFDSAKLVGFDGTPNTPNDFWDDIIAQAVRISKRPKMLEALVESFADPTAALQGKLFGAWMKHNDVLTYNGAPMTLSNNTTAGSVRTPGDTQNIPFECEDCYTTVQATQMNTPVITPLSRMVDRSQPNYDVGMNRSIWQRTMSMINALNGQKLCNKEKGFLTVHGLGFPLKLPALADGFAKCEFIQVNDLVEIYSKAVLGTAKIEILDVSTQAIAVVGFVLLGSSADIQQRESQITGFNDKPTPQSFARFIFAPSNKFIKDLLPASVTNDGVSMPAYEPGALFAMEVPIQLAGNKSFIDLGKPLLKAFDDNELRTGEGKDLRPADGYSFGNLLSVFHKHWSSHKSTPCPPTPTPGQEGCTQSLDASGKFYSPQSNVVSYEPLLYEAFVTHDFTGVLQRAAAKLKTVNIDTKDGPKDGLTILSNLAKRLITPDKEIAYRDGRKFSASNTCAFPAGAKDAPEACDCPAGTTPDASPDLCVVMANGAKIKKGTIIKDGIPPLYLVLDAFRSFDLAMKEPANAERLQAWKAARSNLVDQFIMYADDPQAPGKYIIKNQRGRQIGVRILDFAAERLRTHLAAGDLKQWAATIGPDFEKIVSHPIVAGLLDVLDRGWENEGAGRELANISTYLMDPNNAEAFGGLMVAVADTLTFVDRDKDLTPVIQFASLAVAPNAFAAYDTSVAPNTEEGVVSAALSLSNKVISLDTDPSKLSTIGRILKNAVLPNPAAGGDTPLDIIFDVSADVNRADPNLPTTVPFQTPDNRAVFDQVQQFMLDADRGMERLYLVIQNRKRNVNYTTPQVKAK